MKLPRDLSGEQVAKALCRSWGYRQVHQVGCHVILETETPSHHRLSIPNHHILRLGTLNSILRSVADIKKIEKDILLKTIS